MERCASLLHTVFSRVPAMLYVINRCSCGVRRLAAEQKVDRLEG